MVARTPGPFAYYGDTYAGVTGDSIRAAVDPVDTHASDLGALADELSGDEKRILETTEGDITTSVAANPHVPYDVAIRLGGKAQFAAACTREFALEVDVFDTEVNAINESYRSQVFAAQHDPDVRNGDYLGPNQLFGVRGPVSRSPQSKAARDETMAKRLWEKSVELTGARYDALETAPSTKS